MTVTQIDITQLAIDLNNAGEMAGRSLDDLLLLVANSMAADMVAFAPIDTGLLRSSIKVVVEGRGKITIGPDVFVAPYAWDVEYGTKPHVIEAKPGKVLRFVKDGQVIYTRRVNHPGTKAQPYVQPALDKWAARLGPDAAGVGVDAILRAS